MHCSSSAVLLYFPSLLILLTHNAVSIAQKSFLESTLRKQAAQQEMHFHHAIKGPAQNFLCAEALSSETDMPPDGGHRHT